MLVEQTHEVRHEWRNNERPMRFTDTRLDEQQRAVSLKMVPMSLLLESSTGKSLLMNLIDTPGTPLAFARNRSMRETPSILPLISWKRLPPCEVAPGEHRQR